MNYNPKTTEETIQTLRAALHRLHCAYLLARPHPFPTRFIDEIESLAMHTGIYGEESDKRFEVWDNVCPFCHKNFGDDVTNEELGRDTDEFWEHVRNVECPAMKEILERTEELSPMEEAEASKKWVSK